MTDEVHAVVVPLLNPNEPDAVLVELLVCDGDRVEQGDVICALETSKSVEEIEADRAGFVVGLSHEVGAMLTAGDVLMHLASTPDSIPKPAPTTATSDVPSQLRISEPARRLATELGVALSSLPVDTFVTEQAVRATAAAMSSLDDSERESGVLLADTSSGRIDPTAVIVFGGGGHGETLIELLAATGAMRPVAVVDDGAPVGSHVLGVPVVGGRSELAQLRRSGIGLALNALGGISNMATRVAITELLGASGFALPVLIHPSAVVEPSAHLAEGAQILAHAYVGSGATVGRGVIVNTSAVVSHGCSLDDHVNLSPGVLLAGDVTVGARTLIGMGVSSYIGVTIGSDVRIGNGVVINADVADRRLIHAGSVWDGSG